jgi:hypothetical protein
MATIQWRVLTIADDQIQSVLNELSADNWDVQQLTRLPEGTWRVFVFKK